MLPVLDVVTIGPQLSDVPQEVPGRFEFENYAPVGRQAGRIDRLTVANPAPKVLRGRKETPRRFIPLANL